MFPKWDYIIDREKGTWYVLRYMHIIARKALIDFCTVHPDSKGALETWYHEAKRARWRTSADIKARYPGASFVKNDRVVFNICHNRYRLVAKMIYPAGTVYIRFVGTHAEYDKIDVEVV
jgi:mRNA interferase HigB